MKKIVFILTTLIAIPSLLTGQQAPLSENYFMDRYGLMPSYAGNYNPKYLVMGYRSDWTGIKGGPKTLRLSFNDVFPFMENAGYGGKMVYDKAGIFSQLYISGSYSYKLKVVDEHFVLFGLSMGIYHNTINLLEYYNDPDYTIDPALISQDISSKIKFMSDFSVLYNWKDVEAGVLLSNVSFGDAGYKEVDLKYNPLSYFQFHGAWNYRFAEDWSVSPLMIIRGGKNIRSQFELAAQVIYVERIWSSLAWRDPGVLGFGIGGNIIKGLKISYNFNLATNISMGAFNNHEISVGFNLWDYLPAKTGNR